MLAILEKYLGRVTMYKLMLYFLLLLWVVSIFLTGFDVLLQGIYLMLFCWGINEILAKIFKAKTNSESAVITGLILTLIVGPFGFWGNILSVTFIGATAMASKYVLAWRKKHIFNPSAVAVFLSAIIFDFGASWWVGNIYTLPVILIGGFLVLTKIKRFELVGTFLVVYVLLSFTIPSPVLWFFMLVMLIEPLTSPTTKKGQMIFGGGIAMTYLFLVNFVPGFSYSLEGSLLLGNIFSFLVSRPFNLILVFKKKEEVAVNTFSFYFEAMSELKFRPGQYLEWTLVHKGVDTRGVRRFLSISSSPREKMVAITVKINEKGSSFKKALMNLKPGKEIMASSPMGEFLLPNDKSIPLAFIGGGIGVTPFRSMIKNLSELKEKRDIVLMYANKSDEEISFKEVFEEAKKIGVKTVYINSEKEGHINEAMIKEKIADFKKRMFYISGPEPMVIDIKKILKKMKVKGIKTDYFPGYTK